MKWDTKLTSSGRPYAQEGCHYRMLMLVLTLLPCFLLPLAARAVGQQYVLDFGDSLIEVQRGEESTIFLKKELRLRYPAIDVTALRLQKVTVVARWKMDGGRMQLRVGPETSGFLEVGGDRQSFRSSDGPDFIRATIANPFAPSWGPWQLQFDGNLRIHQVLLEVEDRSPRE